MSQFEMGSGDKSHYFSFHLHVPHQQHRKKGIPKGCVGILVGHEGEEKLERFVVPVIYINHPLFLDLLKEAEEEYGFEQKGPITIPCHADEFRNVKVLIEKEHHRHHHHHHTHAHHQFPCFKA